MKKVFELFSQLIKGGIFFLFPIILVIIFLEKALHMLQPVAKFISEKGGWHFGISENAYLFSILILVFLFLISGYIASQGVGKKMINWIEENILTLFPGYQLMKNTLQNTAGLSTDNDYPVVLAPIDGWMLGFQVDTLSNGDLVIFIPSAPNTWEGSVVIFEKEKIRATNLSQKDVQKIMRQLGVNSKNLLDYI